MVNQPVVAFRREMGAPRQAVRWHRIPHAAPDPLSLRLCADQRPAPAPPPRRSLFFILTALYLLFAVNQYLQFKQASRGRPCMRQFRQALAGPWHAMLAAASAAWIACLTDQPVHLCT